MTICLGFSYPRNPNAKPSILDDVIFMASDSQITTGTAKQADIQKIVEVKFADWPVMVAYAGMYSSAQRFLEIFAEKAAKTEFVHIRTPADVAEDSIRELRQLLAKGYEGNPQQRALDFDCGFILGYFFNGMPAIYTLDLDSMLAVRTRTKFASIGCAANIANFVLTGVDFDSMSPTQAIGLSVAAIELCKVHDSACGGAVQMGILGNEGLHCTILPNVYEENVGEVAAGTSLDVHRFYMNKLIKEFWPYVKKG